MTKQERKEYLSIINDWDDALTDIYNDSLSLNGEDVDKDVADVLETLHLVVAKAKLVISNHVKEFIYIE